MKCKEELEGIGFALLHGEDGTSPDPPVIFPCSGLNEGKQEIIAAGTFPGVVIPSKDVYYVGPGKIAIKGDPVSSGGYLTVMWRTVE